MDKIAKLLGSHANIIYVNANDKKYIHAFLLELTNIIILSFKSLASLG